PYRQLRCPLLMLFSAMSQPRTFALFPYTTLFRSHDQRDHAVDLVAGMLLVRLDVVGGVRSDRQVVDLPPHHRVTADNVKPDKKQDRKSTRLNSRHVKNSYSVFGLGTIAI